MILTFLPALPVHQIPSASSTPFQKTKARLGIHEDMLKEPRMIFYVFFPCHLVQYCNVSRTLRELMWEDGIGGADVQSAMQYPALSWWQPAVPTHRRLKGSLAALVQRLTKLEKESQEQLQYLEVPCPKALPSLSWLWLRLRTKKQSYGICSTARPLVRLGPYDPVLPQDWILPVDLRIATGCWSPTVLLQMAPHIHFHPQLATDIAGFFSDVGEEGLFSLRIFQSVISRWIVSSIEGGMTSPTTPRHPINPFEYVLKRHLVVYQVFVFLISFPSLLQATSYSFSASWCLDENLVMYWLGCPLSH